jgi:peptidoglycan/xylan/chitin deacetylase (PgdA/CDA1 family)
MRFVSPLLRRVVYPVLAGTGYLRHFATEGDLCIITYHGMMPESYPIPDGVLDGGLVTAKQLRAQLRLLKNQYNIVTPETVLAWLQTGEQLPRRAVLLTCDDGLQNGLTEMVPILQEEGLKCLFFVTGASAQETPTLLWYEELYLLLKGLGLSGDLFRELGLESGSVHGSFSAAWWEAVRALSARDADSRRNVIAQLEERMRVKTQSKGPSWNGVAVPPHLYLLTAHELRELVAQGMTIGAHTLSHPILARSSDACARVEIQGSRRALENVIQRPVWAFAYPFGNTDSLTRRDVELAQTAGFTCAFVNVGGGFGADLPKFILPRVHVTSSMGMGEFEAHVSGFYRSLRGNGHPFLHGSP